MSGNTSRSSNSTAVAAALLFALSTSSLVAAQELEPRSYSASPVGANFIVAAYGNSSGSVLLDPSIPVTNVHADVNSLSVGYGHTFALWGVQALVTGAVPYVWGKATLQAQSVDTSFTRSGFGDLRAKISVNFVGSPALTPREFAT